MRRCSQFILRTMLQGLPQGLRYTVRILCGGVVAQEANPQHLVGMEQAEVSLCLQPLVRWVISSHGISIQLVCRREVASCMPHRNQSQPSPLYPKHRVQGYSQGGSLSTQSGPGKADVRPPYRGGEG